MSEPSGRRPYLSLAPQHSATLATSANAASHLRRVAYRVYWWGGRSKWRGIFLAMECLVSEHPGGVFLVDVTPEQDAWISARLWGRP